VCIRIYLFASVSARQKKGGIMKGIDFRNVIMAMTVAVLCLVSLAGPEEREETKIDTTKLEKYQRKVIIKAKVGEGPGEIGVIGEGTMEGPKGITVDSSGNIFILDNVNKRIVKFSHSGKYLRIISLSDLETYMEGLDNHLLIGEDGNFYIKRRAIILGEKIRCKYKYDKNGRIIDRDVDIPKSVLNMQGKTVNGDVPKFTIIKANRDTVVHYYINDAITSKECTIKVHLAKRKDWKYMITPYSFLGFDQKGNAYVSITALENIPVWPPKECIERGLIAKKEEIAFKYDKEGKLVAVIKEANYGIGYRIWVLGGDGALYLMRYSFKEALRDLPFWVKEADISEEEKEKYREKYMVSDGYVYVVKFTKVEEK